MARIPVVVAFCLTAVTAFAQYTPGSVPRSYGYSAAGFGNVLFPGGSPGHPVIAPRQAPGNITNTSFGGALGANVRGVPYGSGMPGAASRSPRTIIVPYPVMSYPYGYGYQQQQEPTIIVQQGPPPQQQPPVVIINQAYRPDTVNPQVREYTDLPPAATAEPTLKVFENRRKAVEDDKPTIFLIAMKDGSVMPALAFWVEDDTLNYITRDSVHNRISLDRVDRDFSTRLNQERGLEFRIR